MYLWLFKHQDKREKPMYKNGKYRETDKMSDLICENYPMVLVMSRFGIALGFGEKNIGAVCRQNGVDACTFLTVVNFLTEEISAPMTNIDKCLSIEALITYLHNAHAYFLDFRLPHIRRKLTDAIADCPKDVAFVISSVSSSAESSAESTADTDNVIKIGATATPHGEILEFVKDKLAKEGYDLQITIYDDYVLPNNAVASGELDANYHQHTPYLNNYNEKNGTDIVPAALIHYEPFGLYGNGVEKLADVKEGASIIIPADDSNETRALLLLQQEGLIELPEGANAKDGVTTLDIKDDHGYKITTVQADTVAAQFANSDAGSLAVINGNYALAAGLDISKALAVEDASGDAAQTYANIVAVKSGNENLPKIQALIKALKSDDVKNFINEKYNGAVVAIF